jgi:pimeloyl-ACP methyl ester carboxylesterase
MIKSIATRDNLKLYCEVHNPTALNTLILAHGNGNSVQDWHTLGFVERLSPHYRLVLMDAIGYGNSSKPHDPKRYTPKKRAEDLITVMDELKIEQAHFLGNSVGGSLGFVLADLYPQRCLSFMIGSAHPYGSSEPIGCNLFPKEFCNIMVEKGMTAFVETVEKDFLHRPFRKGVRERYLENDPLAIAAANTPTWPNRAECLARISVPVLLYAGDLDPVSKLQHEIASKIKNAEVAILPNTDHADAYWQSEKVTPIIKTFLEKHFPFKEAYQKPI